MRKSRPVSLFFGAFATIPRPRRFGPVAAPIKIDIPHKLGRAEARRRIEHGIGQLVTFVPGSRIVAHAWTGDTMAVTIEAMGQRLAASFEVLENRVSTTLDLPPLLSFLAGKFRRNLGQAGTKLLR